MLGLVEAFSKDDGGATAIEYGLIASLMSIVDERHLQPRQADLRRHCQQPVTPVNPNVKHPCRWHVMLKPIQRSGGQ